MLPEKSDGYREPSFIEKGAGRLAGFMGGVAGGAVLVIVAVAERFQSHEPYSHVPSDTPTKQQ